MIDACFSLTCLRIRTPDQPMERETNSLLIKANRVLGTRLVEAGLSNLENMEKANEIFIDFARAKDLNRASLLRILIYDEQTLKESSLLDYQLDHLPVGAILLENYHLDEVLLAQHPVEFMRASWTLPLDFVNDRWYLATAYYMSDVVRKFWEERIGGRITWFVTTMNELETVFERMDALEAANQEETARREA